MRSRWLGLSGVGLLLTALLLNLLGSWLWPAAYWGTGAAGGMGGRMGSGSMMGAGMMGPGMMSNGILPNGRPGNTDQPFDLRFLDNMIMHHQNAVMMAQTMIADSQRPELRDLAQRIITAQQREITQMRQWRRDWYGASDAGTMQEAMMEQMAGGGMMDREQMRQMMGGNVDFDRMFLQMMIPHHQSAIDMAQQALQQAEHPEIKTLAQAIVTAQQAEIQEMQTYLRDWYGERP